MQYDTPREGRSNGLLDNLPMFLIVTALLLWFAFQLAQLISARDALLVTFVNQETPVQNAGKVKAALDALANETKRIADQGNPNAAQIVAALAQRGIKIADPKPQQEPQKQDAPK